MKPRFVKQCQECPTGVSGKKPCDDGKFRCTSCHNKRQRQVFLAHHGVASAYEYLKLHGKITDEYKLYRRALSLKTEHNMAILEYDSMLDKQGGVCAACKRPPEQDEVLCVDHDHSTGKRRGLLCVRCNLTLGMVKDNPTLIKALLGYLMRHDSRRSWDWYFIDVAEMVATRSKDLSSQVGAVLVRDRQVLATGYNGFPTGVNDSLPERQERPTKYAWTVHGEENAILQAGKHGVSTAGATLYLHPLSPCLNCAKAIIQAGIKEVICPNPGKKGIADSSDPAEEILQAAGVILRRPE
jgi:dCMP deaminase